jgi:hypothetical protein
LYFHQSRASRSIPTRRAWAARTAIAIAAFAAARWAGIDFGRLAFGARDLEARRLVDDLHRQAGLAAIIEAEQFHLDVLAFLEQVAWMVDAALAG